MEPAHLETARRIHAEAIVADIHSDIPTDVLRRRTKDEIAVIQRLHVPSLRQGGVSLCSLAINVDSVVGGLHADEGLRLFVDMLDAVLEDAADADDYRLAYSVGDIQQTVSEGRIAMPIGIEGGACIGESLGTIRMLHRLGMRTLTLTWNYRNGIGDGIAEEAGGGGLTRFGVLAIKEMQRLGILVDVSHLAQIGVMQVLQVAERPIVASHSNARALCSHPRNLSDEVTEGIARTGGLVGVCCYPGFIDPHQPTLNRLLDHVDYLVQAVGEDHVAIGGDFIDYMQEVVIGKLQAANIGYLSDTQYPEGIESVKDFHNITAGLVSRGYSETTIKKLLGANYLRVLEHAIG